MQTQQENGKVVHICSDHPMALRLIQEIISADTELICKSMKCSKTATLTSLESPEVLVLDCCSNDNWPDTAIRWQRQGGLTICVMSSEASHYREQLRALYLGVCGIVTVSTEMPKELPMAVRSVLQGRLWYSKTILSEYVKQKRMAAGEKSSSLKTFTLREEQIMSFVMRKFGNKQIADSLGISERTVKHHISNIFRKSQVSNRRELIQAMSSSSPVVAAAGRSGA